jgi:predicted RNA polymerase sigma factor
LEKARALCGPFFVAPPTLGVKCRLYQDMKRISPQEVETARSGGAADVERLLQSVWPEAYRLAYSVLGQRLRAVVVLRYFEQLNSREIAAILRVPDGTVRFRLNRAKQRLRPLLDDEQPFNATPNEVRIHAV